MSAQNRVDMDAEFRISQAVRSLMRKIERGELKEHAIVSTADDWSISVGSLKHEFIERVHLMNAEDDREQEAYRELYEFRPKFAILTVIERLGSPITANKIRNEIERVCKRKCVSIDRLTAHLRRMSEIGIVSKHSNTAPNLIDTEWRLIVDDYASHPIITKELLDVEKVKIRRLRMSIPK